MNRNTRSITQGALTAALSVITVLFDRLVGGFIMPFLPLPLIVYGAYHTLNETILSYVVTVLLVAIVPGSLPTTILMLMYGLIAIVYLMIVKMKIGNFYKFCLLTLGVSVVYGVMIVNFGAFFGLTYDIAFAEAGAMLKFVGIENESIVKNVVYLTIFSTIILETIIISISAKFLLMRIGVHRNKE